MGNDPFIGRTLAGKYQVLERIGAGGMGAVYRARHIETGGDIAVKVLHGSSAFDSNLVRRFQLEAKNAAALSHPNTIRVTDFGVDEGLFYLVMEYLVGRSLAEALVDDGPMPWRRVVRIARQVLKSLWEAHEHERRIIHRDIKPGNIFLVEVAGEPDHVKVLDFGIARSLTGTSAGTQGLIGTPAYMAPEMWRGEPIDARTDLYALGCVAYQMLVGTPPFVAPPSAVDSLLPFLGKHCNDPPPPLSTSAPEVPEPIARWVESLLAKEPSMRPPSARAALMALDQAVEEVDAERRTRPIGGLAPSALLLPRSEEVTPAQTRPATSESFIHAPRGQAQRPERGADTEEPQAIDTSGYPLTVAPAGASASRRSRRPVGLVVGLVLGLAFAIGLIIVLNRPSGDGRPGTSVTTDAAPITLSQPPVLETTSPPGAMEVLAYLPRRTLGVLVFRKPARWFEAMGYETLVSRHRVELAALSAEVRRQVVLDLLEPMAWREAGLDLSGPAGVARLDDASGRYVVFATVNDRARIEAAARRLVTGAGSAAPRQEWVGFGDVFEGGERAPVAVVLRGGLALVVVAGEIASEPASVTARRLAGLRRDESLWRDDRLVAAAGELPTSDDLVGWVDLGALVRPLVDRRVADAFVPDDGWVAVGARLGARSFVSSAFVPLPPTALAMRALGRLEVPPVMVAATLRRPLMMLTGKFEMPAALELLGLVFAAGGAEELTPLRTLVREAFGLDWDKDLSPNLRGDLSIAIDGDRTSLSGLGPEPPQPLSLSAVIGLTDPDAISRVLARIARTPSYQKLGDTYELHVPDLATLRVSLTPGELVISSDADFVARVRDRQPQERGFAATDPHAELRELLMTEGAALLALIPQEAYGLRPIWFPAACTVYEVEAQDFADPALVEVKRELATLRAEDDRAYERARGLRREMAKRGLGSATLGIALAVRPGGLAVTFGDFLEESIAATASSTLEDHRAAERWDAEAERRCERIGALAGELGRARERREQEGNAP